MSSNKEIPIYQKKESINRRISTNSVHSKNSKSQCLYKKEILSSLLKLLTKIKQDRIIKTYNIDNIERENKLYNPRPITVNLNKFLIILIKIIIIIIILLIIIFLMKKIILLF